MNRFLACSLPAMGTLSILAGLDLHDGHVTAEVHPRHRSREFILLLKALDAHYPPGGVLGGAGGSGNAAPLLSLFGVAGVIELVGGILIAIGLLTRYAAFISSGQMAVAYFTAHASKAFWPIQNGGELAVLYCFLFLYIAASGTGIWGVQSES